MEFEQLRQLDAIERTGTISAAAEELHMSQPSISRSMKQLERELGQELFTRTRNHVEFNEAGHLALAHARILLADERRMRDAFDDLARRQRTLRIASIAPAPIWRLTALTVERFPGTVLDSTTVDENEAERRLFDRSADLVITNHALVLPTTTSIQLMTERLSAFIPKSNELSRRTTLSFADLDGQSCIIDKSSGFWIARSQEHLPNSQIVLQEDRMVFRELVRTTDLISFVTDAPQFTDPEYGQAGVGNERVAVPLVDGDASATFYLTALNDAPKRVLDIMAWVRRQTAE